MGYSFLAVCSGLPGGGFYVLYFHPGIVLAEDESGGSWLPSRLPTQLWVFFFQMQNHPSGIS